MVIFCNVFELKYYILDKTYYYNSIKIGNYIL